jgi:hypothetical protein
MSHTEADLLDTPEHRKRTRRQVRHAAKATLRNVTVDGDPDALEDADFSCPQDVHDLGRKASPKPRSEIKPGRRGGFKVWKTRYWKRRRALWAQRNRDARRVADAD